MGCVYVEGLCGWCVCEGVCVFMHYHVHNSILHDSNEMNGVLGHDYALEGYIGARTTWANEMNFSMNHAPGAGSISRPVDQAV